jgi:hypothetical protein
MNLKKPFIFKGNSYTLEQLLRAQTIKVYWQRYRSERKLVVDQYNQLFIYNYEEEMEFGDGPDRENHLWIAVINQKEADQMHLQSNIDIIRPPFIAADETGLININEVEKYN